MEPDAISNLRLPSLDMGPDLTESMTLQSFTFNFPDLTANDQHGESDDRHTQGNHWRNGKMPTRVEEGIRELSPSSRAGTPRSIHTADGGSVLVNCKLDGENSVITITRQERSPELDGNGRGTMPTARSSPEPIRVACTREGSTRSPHLKEETGQRRISGDSQLLPSNGKDDERRLQWAPHGVHTVRRKPAPPVKQTSLPHLRTTVRDTLSARGRTLTDPLTPPPSARQNLDLDTGSHSAAKLVPSTLTPPAAPASSSWAIHTENILTKVSSLITSSNPEKNTQFHPPVKPTRDWRQLSRLDLTCPRGLMIYLHSIALLSNPLETKSSGQRHVKRHSTTLYTPSYTISAPEPKPERVSARHSFGSSAETPPCPLFRDPAPSKPPHSVIRLGLIRDSLQGTFVPIDVRLQATLPSATGTGVNKSVSLEWGMSGALKCCRTTILKRARIISIQSGTTVPSPKKKTRGKDVYLELVALGRVIDHPYSAFLNRMDGSIWLLPNENQNRCMGPIPGFLDDWALGALEERGVELRSKSEYSSSGRAVAGEKIVAIRWADGLHCVNENEVKGSHKKTVERSAASDFDIYLGEGIQEEEDGWYEPEEWWGPQF